MEPDEPEVERPRPPKMNLREFMELGYLQEANRQFFHPLGLALFVHVDDDGFVSEWGVYDDRGDPEGWRFDLTDWPGGSAAAVARFKSNAATIERLQEDRRPARVNALGYWIQPATGESLVRGADGGG